MPAKESAVNKSASEGSLSAVQQRHLHVQRQAGRPTTGSGDQAVVVNPLNGDVGGKGGAGYVGAPPLRSHLATSQPRRPATPPPHHRTNSPPRPPTSSLNTDDTDGEDNGIRRINTMDELRLHRTAEPSEFALGGAPLPRSYRHDSEDDSHLLLGLTAGLPHASVESGDVELTGPNDGQATAPSAAGALGGKVGLCTDFGVHCMYRDGKPRPYFRGWCHGIVTVMIIPIMIWLGEYPKVFKYRR